MSMTSSLMIPTVVILPLSMTLISLGYFQEWYSNDSMELDMPALNGDEIEEHEMDNREINA